jgi:PHD/YefM family antitoxin component YafN of YafNO toxin-antitoxin module
MIDIHPQFLTDTAGQKLVVLSLREFDSIMEELEDLEDIRLFDQAKKDDDGSRILFSDYLKTRESGNG